MGRLRYTFLMEKECFKCGEVKPLSSFYKHKKMKDGHTNKCKECTKIDVALNRIKNIDKIREYDRNRPNKEERGELSKIRTREAYKDPIKREKLLASKRRWIDNNPEKRKAHIIAGNAIRDGKLTKLPCEVCGEFKVEAHHGDYSKPLQVKWLCRKHHAEEHSNL